MQSNLAAMVEYTDHCEMFVGGGRQEEITGSHALLAGHDARQQGVP